MKAIKNLAVLHSAIIGAITASSEPPTINDLMVRANIVATNATKATLWSALATMHKRGLLKRVRVDRRATNDTAMYAYELADGSQTPARKAPQASAITEPAPKPSVDVVVDVVKATGRLHITYHGIVIEIGVIL
jgi:hypothetical protein